MPANPAILIRTGPDDDRDWRRFVAILCFIEFYSQFVLSGKEIWRTLHPRFLSRATLDPAMSFYLTELVAQIVRALMIFAIGQALWRRRGRVWLWTIGAVIASVVAVSACVLRAWAGQDPYFNWWRIVGFGPKAWGVFAQELDHLPWLVLLIIVSSLRHRRPNIRPLVAGWVLVAIGWTLARFAADCSVLVPHPGAPFGSFRDTGLADWMQQGLRPILNQPRWMGPVAALAPLGLVGLLVLRSRLARWAAITVLALDATPIIVSGVVWPLLVDAGIQALLNTVPLPLENPFRPPWLFLNCNTFTTFFVDLVRLVGPWLLIAHYARSKPMTPFSDDGSPWPRRYCGKCYYNLHGVAADRCPECGATLIAADRGSGRPLRHP